MPLLPWQRFPEGFEAIKAKANECTGTDRAKLNKLLKYIEKNWVKNAKIVSVYEAHCRTNNYVESANRYLKSKCGVRSNLWKVIGKHTKHKLVIET